MPIIPALGRQRPVDLWEFEASLVYRASSRPAKATQSQKRYIRRAGILKFSVGSGCCLIAFLVLGLVEASCLPD